MNTKMLHVTRRRVIWLVVAVAGLFGSQTIVTAETNGNSDEAVTVSAQFTVAQDSREGTLSITASIREGFHIYAMTQPKPFIATQIHVDESDRFQLLDEFTPSRAAKFRRHESLDVELHEHEGKIDWTVPLGIAAGVQNEEIRISGHVLAQACTEDRCLAPKEFPFVAKWNPNKAISESATTIDMSAIVSQDTAEFPPLPADGPAVTEPPTEPVDLTGDLDVLGKPEIAKSEATTNDRPKLDFSRLKAVGSTSASLPLIVVLPMAFAAGFFLNFMPCVLPVIGLKIMTFAQQGGDSRRRVFKLNLWYTFGMLAVFWVLATLAVAAGLSWGQQFSSVAFNAVLASVVFVFALSFLGVWEIPIPGFVGSGKAGELAQREGAVGAISKGVLTTVLATPCSGPLLGAALTWAVMQPPLLTYLTFTFVGLGMASPYLVVGVFPKLIGFLPKPGPWMDTFKQIMGFVLLATVVYLLTIIPLPYVVPTVALMIGLWAACWWIGRTALTANVYKKVSTWIQAAAFAAVVGFVAFGWLYGVMESRFQRAVDRELSQRTSLATPSTSIPNGETTTADAAKRGKHKDNELPWRPYSRALLEQLIADGKTVLVDFTADWCLTCKTNETVALNTSETRRFVEANG
ncbi:MAG: thioredoxin family protein, partial [Planctomycetes bacterium]|nr:thioredoxin family protein [Planctomycetota bacterium]